MTTPDVSARPDTTDMYAIHRVFRDVIGAADALITPVAADDDARIAVIANFYGNVLSLLAVHHQGEDELLFPLLRERCPDQLEAVERVGGQHHEVEGLIPQAQQSLVAWAAGEPDAAARAVAALRALEAPLIEHLDAEERDILPLCAEHMSLPEWGALPGHGMAHFTGDKIWLILGLIRDRMTQQQRDDMIAHMPPPAVEMWTGFGEVAYRRLLAEVGPPLG